MKNNSVVIAIVAGIAFFFAAIALGISYYQTKKPVKTVSVVGLAEKDFTSDLIVWNLSYDVLDMDMKQAYTTVKNQNSIVKEFLKSKGIPSRLRVKELPKKFDYIFATPRMERYIEKSSEVVGIMLDFFDASDIHVYSIDEAFIDMTSYLSYYKKTPLQMVEMIINEITKRTGLMATAGIGDNFFLAKVALDVYAKQEKNGIAIMRMKDVKTKLWPITPLSKIWGIGERTEQKLNKMGIFTVENLANSNRDYIHSRFGIMGDQLIDHANGIDEADIHEQYIPKETSLTHGQVLFRDFTLKEIPVIIKEIKI